jgi:hypothetical protein
VTDAASRAAEVGRRAAAIREQGRRLAARAQSMPPGAMREMLEGQAKLLADGARGLEDEALALAPPAGTA